MKIILSAFLLFTITAHAQKKDSSFTITGNLTAVKTGKIYLIRFYPGTTAFDSVEIANGKFQFKGFVQDPGTAVISFQRKNPSDFYRFLLEPGIMTVKGKGDTLTKLVMKGSKMNDENAVLAKLLKPARDWENRNDSVYELASKANNKAVLDSLDKMDKPIMKMKRAVVADFVKKHPSSQVSAFAIQQNFGYYAEASDVEPLYQLLTPAIKQSKAGKEIQKMITGYKTVAVGMIVPEVAQNDTSGNIEKLSSLKGHYVLLDFWASWCRPCRAENPNIVKAYAAYHPKGLEIFGVSYDIKTGKAKWIKAINDDGLGWHQVSELAGWQNSTSDQFYIKSIPSNMLLDKDGRIIAKNLFGDELTAKLKELMPG